MAVNRGGAMTKPLCYTHRDRETAPELCAVCKRIEIEQRIVKAVVKAALAAGYYLAVYEGQNQFRPATPTNDEAIILAELMETDDDYLWLTRLPNADTAYPLWVRFVYGNDGWDVICDYHVGLEELLKPINALADTLDPR